VSGRDDDAGFLHQAAAVFAPAAAKVEINGEFQRTARLLQGRALGLYNPINLGLKELNINLFDRIYG